MQIKKAFGIYLLTFLFTAVGALPVPHLLAQSGEPFAVVLNATGETILNHKDELQPVENGTVLLSNDILITREDGNAIVRFSDNSGMIKVLPSTTVELKLSHTQDGISKNLELKTGYLWVQVKPGIGSTSVLTSTAASTVRGTDFLVRVNPENGNTTVYVFDGIVELGNDYGITNITTGNQGCSDGNEIPSMEKLAIRDLPPEIQNQLKAGMELEPVAFTPRFPTESYPTPATPEVPAKGKEKPASTLLPFPLTMDIGAVSINDQIYTQIRLMPEISIWKFGVGLDLNLLIDSDGNIRKEDWNDFEDYLNKILYLRYATKQDPFYFRIGSFPSVRFGYGLIMRDYTNMLNYPDEKQLGLEIAVKGKTHDLTFDIFSPNIYELDIFAGRITGKPLLDSGVPIIKDLQLGATVVTDLNQLGGLDDKDGDGYPDKYDDFPEDERWQADTDGDSWPDPPDSSYIGHPNIDIDANNDNIPDSEQPWDILNLKQTLKIGDKKSLTTLGFDYMLPLVSTDGFQLYHYSEVAHILNHGWGATFPGFGSHFLIFDLNLEYKILGQDFEPNYFNRIYDNQRAIVDTSNYTIIPKESRLKNINKAQGWRGELTLHLLDIMDLSIAYEDIKGEDYEFGKSIYGQLSFTKTFIPRLSYAFISYSQTQVEKFSEWKTPTAIIEAELGYTIAPSTLLIGSYKEYYDDRNGDGKITGKDETISSFTLGVQISF